MADQATRRKSQAEEQGLGDDVPGSVYFVDALKRPRRLPQWLDHFNAKDLKILFKSSVAVWIVTIFIFINATLRVLGQAAFFGCVVLFIMPPSGVVLIQLFAGVMVCLGLALGWAWGTITMKAALATRPQADLAARYRELQLSAPKNTTNAGQASGQTNFAQIAVFDGFMLDTRVTITYFCMMGLFVYLVARIRVTAPKMTLVAIFAMVVADIYLAMAPLFPTFQGTIPKVILLPASVAVGVGALCNILIFPQSTSKITRDGMKDVLAPMKGFIDALAWHFNHPERRLNARRLQELRGNLLAAHKGVESSHTFLPMDFSYSRWSPQDIGSLRVPLRGVFIACGEVIQLAIAREEAKNRESALTEAAKAIDEKEGKQPVAYYQIAKTANFHDYARHPETDRVIAEALGALSASTDPLLLAWHRALDVAIQAMTGGVARKDVAETLEAHQTTLSSLKEAHAEFESSSGDELIDASAHLFDAEGNFAPSQTADHAAPLSGLMIAILYQERIMNLSSSTVELLEKIIDIEEVRLKPRLWLPRGLQRLFAWALSDDETPSTVQEGLSLTRTATIMSQKPKKKGSGRKPKAEPEPKDDNTAAARLEAMRRRTGRQRQRASTILLAVIGWFTSDEGLYALRTLVVTIALATPAVITTTAGFYYREKGLWALIMGQLSLLPYASDFVSGLVIRTAATVCGGVLGLLCWYIGAGSGPGNPYGLAAVMAVAIVVMMWWRLFGAPQHVMAGIMLTSTMFMVVSYSWVDTHIPSYGNPGVGYVVFWRRILLVLIGFAGATIVTFLPRPPSGNRRYRQMLSEQLSSIRDRYALFVSVWQSPPGDLVETVEKEGIVWGELLISLAQPIKLTKFEFSTSNFNADSLAEICHICTELNEAMTQLILYTTRMPSPLRTRFISQTGAMDESLVADLMAVLTLLQQSLITGAPLPAVLPTPLVGRATRFGKRKASGPPPDEDDTARAREQLAEEGGRQWVSAVHAYVRLLGAVDHLVLAVKKAIGEGSNIDLGILDSSERV